MEISINSYKASLCGDRKAFIEITIKDLEIFIKNISLHSNGEKRWSSLCVEDFQSENIYFGFITKEKKEQFEIEMFRKLDETFEKFEDSYYDEMLRLPRKG